MTDPTRPGGQREARPPYRTAIWGVLRVAGTAAILVTLYYSLPLDRSPAWAAATLIIGLVLFMTLIAAQVRRIIRSPFPGLRAVEALATSIPLFLLLFASTYYVMARNSASNFTEPLTRTDALYFTITVFSTVGFGDITAKSQATRLVVTGQMIADLIILGLGIRIIVGAVTRSRERQPEDVAQDNQTP